MSLITTPDRSSLYLKDWGSGPAVVLLAGWPLTADSWDDLALPLAAAGFRVLAYDRRGFGRSSQPWDGYDYDSLADDLATVLQRTEVSEATLVGFSMGGGEVARYLSRHAGRSVGKAVLIASVVPGRPPGDAEGAAKYERLSTQLLADRAHFFGGFFRDFFGVDAGQPAAAPLSEELIDWARQQAMMASLRATLACAHSFCSTDFRADLAAFKVPTLIIHGDADRTVPIDKSARAAHAGIAGSSLLVYEGAPHGLFATHKTRLVSDLLRFLQT